jgi:hypothetical protein
MIASVARRRSASHASNERTVAARGSGAIPAVDIPDFSRVVKGRSRLFQHCKNAAIAWETTSRPRHCIGEARGDQGVSRTRRAIGIDEPSAAAATTIGSMT